MKLIFENKHKLSILLSFYCFILVAQPQIDSSKLVNVSYGKKGFEMKTRDDKFLMQIQSRIQFRYTTPFDQDPVTFDDFKKEKQVALKINRARLKIGGHAFEPWLNYYWEYELSQSNLLDFRIMIEKWKWLSFKVGQWKVEYTRERFISSGEQQLVDRSLLNRYFTVDRQQGVEIYGHLKGKGIADFNYWIGVFTGTGRGNGQNDDANLMYFGKAQWNFFGRSLNFQGGDLEFSEKPKAVIAIAGITNRSPYTRFSQSGGGQIEGFIEENNGQYRINQYNIESALIYRGFSWQSEWHHKYIIDRINSDKLTQLRGYFVQAGYFFNNAFDWFPKNLEIAGRHAVYKPNKNLNKSFEKELTLGVNYFFKGHKNKLTAEISHFDLQDQFLHIEDRWRFRIQWDISI